MTVGVVQYIRAIWNSCTSLSIDISVYTIVPCSQADYIVQGGPIKRGSGSVWRRRRCLFNATAEMQKGAIYMDLTYNGRRTCTMHGVMHSLEEARSGRKETVQRCMLFQKCVTHKTAKGGQMWPNVALTWSS